jgi:ABC-type histidine transport system ATPase subunit
MTMLVVTHEMQFVREVGTRIVFMDAGRIVEEAEPTAFFRVPKQEPGARVPALHKYGYHGLIERAPLFCLHAT